MKNKFFKDGQNAVFIFYKKYCSAKKYVL